MDERITLRYFEHFLEDFRDFANDVRLIREALTQHGKIKLQFGSPNSVLPNSQIREENTMPGKETDTQTIPCSEVETDAAGNPVTLVAANVQWSIDDPTIATLTQNADGSATFKAVKPVAPAVNPRTANVTCTDTVTGAVGTDTLEVDDSATQPGKLTLTFGAAA